MTPEDFIRRHTDCGLCEYPPDMHEALDHLKRRIAELEARPALAWSTEPPKVAGWYWCECSLRIHRTLVYVEPTGGSWQLYCRWAGPIPEPAEPGEVG